jgi:hypothetical protein
MKDIRWLKSNALLGVEKRKGWDFGRKGVGLLSKVENGSTVQREGYNLECKDVKFFGSVNSGSEPYR